MPIARRTHSRATNWGRNIAVQVSEVSADCRCLANGRGSSSRGPSARFRIESDGAECSPATNFAPVTFDWLLWMVGVDDR
jgi:hypothetical protein